MTKIGPRERSAILLARCVHLGQFQAIQACASKARVRGLSAGDIRLLLAGDVPDDRAMAILVATAWLLLDSHGRLAKDDVSDLKEAGIGKKELREVTAIVGIGSTCLGVW